MSTPTDTEKRCSRCHHVRPIEDFALNGTSPAGKPMRKSRCALCRQADHRGSGWPDPPPDWTEPEPATAFAAADNGRCLDCALEALLAADDKHARGRSKAAAVYSEGFEAGREFERAELLAALREKAAK